MPVESRFDYISDLDQTSPLGTEPLSQGDEHLRGIKNVLKNQFPQLGEGIIEATAQELSDAGAFRRGMGGIYAYATAEQFTLPANGSWVTIGAAGHTGYNDGALVTPAPGSGTISIASAVTPDRVNINMNTVMRLKTNASVPDNYPMRLRAYRVSNGERVEGSICAVPVPDYNDSALLVSNCVDVTPAAANETYRFEMNQSYTSNLTFELINLHWYIDVLGKRP